MKEATTRPESAAVRVRKLAPTDPLALLRQAPDGVRVYWSAGHDRAVAFGAAQTFADAGQATRALRALAGGDDAPVAPRVYGGFAFDPTVPGQSPWDAFAPTWFVLPQRQVVWHGQDAYEFSVPGQADHTPPGRPPTPTSADEEGKSAWTARIDRIQRRLASGSLTKVVLARCERLAQEAHPIQALEALEALGEPGFRFLIEPASGHAFYGSTPELLVRVEGEEAQTTALAGSMPRASNPAQDAALGRILQTNPKDSLEHELVVSYLLETLGNARPARLRHEPRRLLRLRHIQHLETPIHATFNPRVHAAELARALHPTPAVAGLPPEDALAMIRRLEPGGRGWYAGAVGWFDAQGDGCFATAIRSALTTPEGTWLHAGAGVVAGSDADQEWEETQVKLRTMREALGAP